MRALGAALAGIHRRPLGIAALLVVSLVFGAAAATVRVSVLDAEARAQLTAERDRLAAEIASVADRTSAARVVAADSDECVRDAAGALEPAVAASARFSTTTVGMGESVIALALPSSPDGRTAGSEPAGTATLPLVSEGAAATRGELLDALDRLGELRASGGVESQAARLAALERHAACDAAQRAVEAVLAEVTARTEEVIAASGMAPAEVVAKLRAARDEVLAESADEPGITLLPEWLAAASEVETTHAAAEAAAAEAAAAEAARRAAAGADTARSDIFPPDWYTVPRLELGLSEAAISACLPDCDPYGTGEATPAPGWELPEGLR